MAWMAPPCLTGDACLCHDGRNPPSRQSAIAQKNQTPDHGKSQGSATPSLIRWSMQEIRRIAVRIARKRIQPALIVAWSIWRRAHQAAAQRAHLKAKRQLYASDNIPVSQLGQNAKYSLRAYVFCFASDCVAKLEN